MRFLMTLSIAAAAMSLGDTSAFAQSYGTPFYGAPAQPAYTPAAYPQYGPVPNGYTVPTQRLNYSPYAVPVAGCPNGNCCTCVNGYCRIHGNCANGQCGVRYRNPYAVYRPAVPATNRGYVRPVGYRAPSYRQAVPTYFRP